VKDKPIESFTSLVDLRNTLAADHAIRPLIHKVDNRIDMERRNVQVKAYIYLIYNEGDNDFHRSLDQRIAIATGTTMLTAEVSALPRAKTVPPFSRSESMSKDTFGTTFPIVENPSMIPFRLSSPAPFSTTLTTGLASSDREFTSQIRVGKSIR